MKNERNYIEDIAEIRSMMERSSKFLSLSGWAGIMAGIYALLGVWFAYSILGFRPTEAFYEIVEADSGAGNTAYVVITAILILLLTIVTAILLSQRKTKSSGEKIWNAASKQLIINLSVPLAAGGILTTIFLIKGFAGLLAPSTLLFYGLALYNAGKFTYGEVKLLGILQMGLGLLGFYIVEYALILWAIGFGVVHVLYGIYIYKRHGQ